MTFIFLWLHFQVAIHCLWYLTHLTLPYEWQAKEYRDQAVAGEVGDEERRSRAEAVALALSNMLGVSDGDSD